MKLNFRIFKLACSQKLTESLWNACELPMHIKSRRAIPKNGSQKLKIFNINYLNGKFSGKKLKYVANEVPAEHNTGKKTKYCKVTDRSI